MMTGGYGHDDNDDDNDDDDGDEVDDDDNDDGGDNIHVSTKDYYTTMTMTCATQKILYWSAGMLHEKNTLQGCRYIRRC